MSILSNHPAIQPLQAASICVVGLAREGLATYRFLRSLFPEKQLALADRQTLANLDPAWQAIATEDLHLTWHHGENHLASQAKYEYIFVTPGIPTSQPAIATALAQGTKLHSNTQLFFELCPCPIIGITGTKGKSTTTSLIHHVLTQAGKQAVLLGNIGIPPLTGLDQLTANSLAVVELSCHQLQHLPYSPHIAVIQNITPEHLDYYPTFADYVQAKTAIAAHQTEQDLVIYDSDFDQPRYVAELGAAKSLTYSLTNHTAGQVAWLANDWLMWQHQPIISIQDIPLAGNHNLLNVLPSIIIGKQYGLTNQQIADAIKSFTALPHRLQLVAEQNGVKYYDDSLATEPYATINALTAFSGKSVVLLAGGYERHQEYSELAAKILTANIKALILFPTTGQRLWQDIQTAAATTHTQLPPVHFVQTMSEAVLLAKQAAKSGDVVLLSPAAASFGIFKDYHDRGLQFATAAKE